MGANHTSVSFYLLRAPTEPNTQNSPVQSNYAERENLGAQAGPDENSSTTVSPRSQTSLNTYSQGENTQQEVMKNLRTIVSPSYDDLQF